MLSKGVVLRGDCNAEIVAVDVPDPTGTQVRVRTHAVGLCGSDISLYLGTYEGPRNYPLYFGHEWSGTVDAVGPQVTRVAPGDRVTASATITRGATTELRIVAFDTVLLPMYESWMGRTASCRGRQPESSP